MIEIAVKDFKIAVTVMLRDLKGNVNIMRREVFLKNLMELLVLRNT